MFNIYNKYRSSLGSVNFSQALTYSKFESISRGIGLKYVQAGREDYVVNDKIIEVEKGQWMLLRDELDFQVFSDKKAKAVNGICVDLNTDLLIQAHEGFEYCDLLFNLPIPCGASTFTETQFDFSDPIMHNKLSDKRNQQLIEAAFDRVVEIASMIYELQFPLAANAKKIETQQQLLLALFRVQDYIHQYYYTNFTLDDLAHIAQLSKYHLHRLFKACFHLSPKDLQIKLRIQKAKTLLSEESLPIHSIADQLGYNDTAAFSNQFRYFYKQTPFQYRANCKN
ncbi:MAG: AraC family transcriptional regulator [Bacteroidota bacterium]